MIDFKALFKRAIDAGASDVHLQGGRVPTLRVHGDLVRTGLEAVGSEELKQQIGRMVPGHLKAAFTAEAEALRGLDFSYTDAVAGRFRCSVFSALGEPGMTMRSVPDVIPTIADLHLPTGVMDIALSQRGLTLVTGTTGSGKSTSLAGMVELMNSNYDV